eukprot:TRINITY_DN2284_c0_g1_i2.p1 TRINITY_DN2284_c0_g1~~TRINITY_DN2284_c0_g1_i2.p1  ORF type:complete len:612 (+),score=120.15 TRINITY_DN2284_c0_g1_i2:418-2253(+)
MIHRPKRYVFKDGLKHKNREEFLDILIENVNNEDYVTAEPIECGTEFNVCYVDTSGLMDTNPDKEEDNIINIIKTINDQKLSINAVFFFVKEGHSYSGPFQDLVQYYCKWLSCMIDKFVIVHTSWDPLLDKQEVEKCLMDRKNEFSKLNPMLSNTKHFFIDSMITKSRAKQILTYNDFESLISYVREWPATSLNIQVVPKTSTIIEIDKKIVEYLNGIEAGVQQALDVVQSELKLDNLDLFNLENEDTKERATIKISQHLINELDNDNLIKIADNTLSEGFGGIQLFRAPNQRTLSIECEHPYEDIQVSVDQYCTIENIRKDDDHYSAQVNIKSDFWMGASGSLIALCKSKIYYADQIKVEYEKIRRAEENLKLIQVRRDKLNELVSKNIKLENLHRIASFVSQMKSYLQYERMPLVHFLQLVDLYQRGGNVFQKYCELFDIVQILQYEFKTKIKELAVMDNYGDWVMIDNQDTTDDSENNSNVTTTVNLHNIPEDAATVIEHMESNVIPVSNEGDEPHLLSQLYTSFWRYIFSVIPYITQYIPVEKIMMHLECLRKKYTNNNNRVDTVSQIEDEKPTNINIPETTTTTATTTTTTTSTTTSTTTMTSYAV